MEDDIRELLQEIDKIRGSCSWICNRMESILLKVKASRDLNAELKETVIEICKGMKEERKG